MDKSDQLADLEAQIAREQASLTIAHHEGNTAE